MKILFSGGGTLGPVTPLLALVETIRARSDAADFEFLWIGTERGVELPYVRRAGIPLYTISSGKLRRYFSLANLTDFWHIISGVFEARRLLREHRPDVVVTAGGFVSVPVHIAAWTCGIPSIVHQQDVIVGLANRIMSWFATRITVSIDEHLKKFNPKKTVLTGNPVRPSMFAGSEERGREIFKLQSDRATIFVFGGGTGSDTINRATQQLVHESLGMFQIIHLTGTNRTQSDVSDPFYHPYPFFIGEMADAYAVADVVVGRAGFNTISEVAAVGKPSILIPMYGSHQEVNAAWAARQGAARVVSDMELSSERLMDEIRGILENEEVYKKMSDAAAVLFPRGAAERIIEEIGLALRKK